MRWNIVGAFIRNNPFGTEIAFRKGLERIGETVTVIDPSYPGQTFDGSPDVTLIFKWLEPGIYRHIVQGLPGKKIVYQVDDLRFDHIKTMMIAMRDTCDHALTFDDDGASLARQYGYKSAQRLLLTADNQLYRPIPGMVRNIDVSFVGSLSSGYNHRSRMRMLEIVRGMGLKMLVANELFDIPKINQIYNQSKIVLNHATDVGQPFGHGYGYQCRHFEAGFAGACVLSNKIDNDDALNNIVTFDSEQNLVEQIQRILTGWDAYYSDHGDALHAELTTCHTPEIRAQEMLQFVRSL